MQASMQASQRSGASSGSFISNGYVQVKQSEEKVSEGKKECLICLEQLDDSFSCFYVPVSDTIYHAYNTDEFLKYAKTFMSQDEDEYEYEEVKDPQRILKKLNHLLPRAELFSLYVQYKIHPPSEIEKTKCINDLFNDCWNNNNVPDYFLNNIFNTSKYFYFNILDFEHRNFIHHIDPTVAQKTILNMGLGKGSFLIRTSLTSSSEKEITIFTVSYQENNNAINNERYAIVHRVGLYNISSYSRVVCNSLNTVLQFLEYTNYKKPDYFNIIDMLHSSWKCGLINLSLFITPEMLNKN